MYIERIIDHWHTHKHDEYLELIRKFDIEILKMPVEVGTDCWQVEYAGEQSEILAFQEQRKSFRAYMVWVNDLLLGYNPRPFIWYNPLTWF